MPHVAITMLPGRSVQIKESLAIKVQSLLAQELSISKEIISVSIEDVTLEKWDESMKRIDSENMVISPRY